MGTQEGNASRDAYRTSPDDSGTGGGSRRQDAELRRMAIFRIREAANRLATLANGVQDDGLRTELMRIYRALLEHERALQDGTPPPRTRGDDA